MVPLHLLAQGAIKSRQEHFPLSLGIHRISNKICARAQVSKHAGRVFVKVKK
jgi:hypothetical protein